MNGLPIIPTSGHLRHEITIGIWPNAHNPFDAAIKFLTHGDGGHAGFIGRDDRVYENFYPHAHVRDWTPGEKEIVEQYSIPGLSKHDYDNLERWLVDELKHPSPYSIADLFRYAVNLPPVKGKGCFCSMWVLRGCREALAANRQPLARLLYQDYAPPSQVRSSPILRPSMHSRKHFHQKEAKPVLKILSKSS